jgi:predicted nucleic acid-binding protein
MTQIVVDANILVRAVLGKKVRGVIEQYAPTVQFFTPDCCFVDAAKYLPALLKKKGLPSEICLQSLDDLALLVQTISVSRYYDYEQEAKARIAIRDIDDWPIVALALTLNCPIWTEDADFFGAGIATWTSDRVHLYFDKG